MSFPQLKQRCPSSAFVCKARLPGYALAFTHLSMKRKCGVADIVISSHGDCVWGAIFDMTEEDIVTLDRYEGVYLAKPAYRKLSTNVLSEIDERIAIYTYEVVTKSAVTLKPTREYRQLLIDGARQWELPANYIKQLESIEVQ